MQDNLGEFPLHFYYLYVQILRPQDLTQLSSNPWETPASSYYLFFPSYLTSLSDRKLTYPQELALSKKLLVFTRRLKEKLLVSLMFCSIQGYNTLTAPVKELQARIYQKVYLSSMLEAAQSRKESNVWFFCWNCSFSLKIIRDLIGPSLGYSPTATSTSHLNRYLYIYFFLYGFLFPVRLMENAQSLNHSLEISTWSWIPKR